MVEVNYECEYEGEISAKDGKRFVSIIEHSGKCGMTSHKNSADAVHV